MKSEIQHKMQIPWLPLHLVPCEYSNSTFSLLREEKKSVERAKGHVIPRKKSGKNNGEQQNVSLRLLNEILKRLTGTHLKI